jgi:hypothetical protein
MVKRGKGIVHHKDIRKEEAVSHATAHRAEQLLIENFVSLQKVLTEQAINFERLTKQVAALLELFETAAKAMAEKEIKVDKKEPAPEMKELVKKLDYLAEQNRTIAKGLVMLHERSSQEGTNNPGMVGMNVPALQSQGLSQGSENKNVQGYQKSISSGF